VDLAIMATQIYQSTIQILNSAGKLIDELLLQTSENTSLDIRHYKPGVYFISTDKGEVFKLLKLNN